MSFHGCQNTSAPIVYMPPKISSLGQSAANHTYQWDIVPETCHRSVWWVQMHGPGVEKVPSHLQDSTEVPTDNKSALLQVMVWCQTGAKLLPEPMMTQFADTCMHHVCITRPDWVNLNHRQLIAQVIIWVVNKENSITDPLCNKVSWPMTSLHRQPIIWTGFSWGMIFMQLNRMEWKHTGVHNGLHDMRCTGGGNICNMVHSWYTRGKIIWLSPLAAIRTVIPRMCDKVTPHWCLMRNSAD